jgi:HSP20 family molecular chaperone IbpA
MSSRPKLQPVSQPSKIRIFGGDGLFYRMKEAQQRIADRAYELFECRGCTEGGALEDWLCAEREILLPMPIELFDYDDRLVVQAEVPGFNECELDISVEPRRLYIRGTRQQATREKTGETLYSEPHSNQAFRSVDLPAEVDPDRVEPRLNEGILNVTLPKVMR